MNNPLFFKKKSLITWLVFLYKILIIYVFKGIYYLNYPNYILLHTQYLHFSKVKPLRLNTSLEIDNRVMIRKIIPTLAVIFFIIQFQQ